jgi:hypothetical protein
MPVLIHLKKLCFVFFIAICLLLKKGRSQGTYPVRVRVKLF